MVLRRGSWSEKRANINSKLKMADSLKSVAGDFLRDSSKETVKDFSLVTQKLTVESVPKLGESNCEKLNSFSLPPRNTEQQQKTSLSQPKVEEQIKILVSSPESEEPKVEEQIKISSSPPRTEEPNCENLSSNLSRVDLILNNRLFMKHLSKHSDLLKKRMLYSKRFGMRKSVSNMDISCADYTEIQINRNSLTAGKNSEVMQTCSSSSVDDRKPKICRENDDKDDSADNDDVFASDEFSESRKRKHLRRNSVSMDMLFVSNDFSARQVDSSSRTRALESRSVGRQKKLSIPSFEEFRKQRGGILSGRLKCSSLPSDQKDPSNTLLPSEDYSQREETQTFSLHPILEDEKLLPEMDRRGSLTEKKHSSRISHLRIKKGDNSIQEHHSSTNYINSINPEIGLESTCLEDRRGSRSKQEDSVREVNSFQQDNSSNDIINRVSIENNEISGKCVDNNISCVFTKDLTENTNAELTESLQTIAEGAAVEVYEVNENFTSTQRRVSRSGSQIAWDLCNSFNETSEFGSIKENSESFDRGENCTWPESSDAVDYLLVEDPVSEQEESVLNPQCKPPLSLPSPIHAVIKKLRTKKDDEIQVLRSTSDVSEKTSDIQRKKRDRKERPYKSDPFSNSDNIHQQNRGKRILSLNGALQTGEEMCQSETQKNVDGIFHSESVNSVISESPSVQSLEEIQGDFSESDTDSLSESERRSRNRLSNVSTVSTDSGVIGNDLSSPENTLSTASQQPQQQQQQDSGNNIYCPDCNPTSLLDMTSGQQVALVCSKCLQKRLEQKKTIQEIVETEISYGRDLHILKEEFYNPMKATGLLSADQLEMVFINLEELINVNTQFTEKLQQAVSAALQINNNCLSSVHIGRLFIESSQMFLAFENYCVGQALASQTLEQLEKEKELLHVFLQVSQRDNAVLRRMHLKSFLMVPVQRIMRYPLLLCRLYKSTANSHKDKDDIKRAQEKIEDILSHINARTKSSGSFHMKRKRPQQRKYSLTEKLEVNRVAYEVLGWNKKEVTELITSRLMVATTTDHMWAAKKCKNLKFTQLHGTILTLGQARMERRNSDHLMFPRHTQVQQAAVVLVREKNGKYQAARDPMFLDKSVITVDPEYDEVFELHEWGHEPSLFKAEDSNETRMWIQLLRQQTRDLGKWRMRRNAMPNIMIKNMV